MHIYAHILAVEDDEAGRRGFHKLREPYLCKCSGIRVTPCTIFLADLSFNKLTLLEFGLDLPILYVIRKAKGGEKERERKKKRRKLKEITENR